MALALLPVTPTPLQPQFALRRHRNLRVQPLNSTATTSSSPENPNGIFLDPKTLTQLQIFTSFCHTHHLPDGGGRLEIRPLAAESEADAVVRLLAESFARTVRWAPAQRYAQLLAFVVKQYVNQRRRVAPHAAILVGFLKKEGEEDEEGETLACTAEVSLDAIGAPGGLPTPVPPEDCPYICNMTVEMSLRRRGFGKQILKACEDLVVKMSGKRRVYLHCRLIDEVPFNMYSNAGYSVVQTDSILVWLSLRRRKYLMCKELPQTSIDDQLEETAEIDVQSR